MNMKSGIALFLAFASLFAMTFSLTPIAFAAVGGPATGNMLIKIYFDPTVESMGLDKGEIDINDWPLAKEYIDKWSPPTSEVALASVSELGKMQIDLNNQRWPTGWGGVGPGEPPAPRNEFFDDPSNPGVPKNERHLAAWHFRRAISHLTNKPKIITDFLKGYGYAMETPVPFPALEKYTDYGETGEWGLQNAAAKAERADNPYADKGFIYEFDPQAATKELELGGFEDFDGDGVIEWNLDYPDAYAGNKEELPTMNFYIRIDDPNRRQAGEDLAIEMSKVGIKRDTEGGPLHIEIRERSTCFSEVMVRYNYNLYTGGWMYSCLGALLDPDLDFLYDLYCSKMGQFYRAPNYPGFKNRLYDSVAYGAKYPPAIDNAYVDAVKKAQWTWAKYIPVIPLWTSRGAKAYRTGWNGVLNMDGKGIDNRWSKHNMIWVDGPGTSRLGPPNTIVEGFLYSVDALHIIGSQWLWDWKALDEIYDSLITRNPFNLQQDVGILATYWETGTWNYETRTYVRFTIRSDATFHDGSLVAPEDVRFSIIFPRDCGIGNAWLYPQVMDVAKVDTQAQDATLGPNDVKVYFNVKSAWALHWAGSMPIINKKMWMAVCGPGTAAGYSGPTNDGSPGTFTNVIAVTDYHPWDQDRYNAVTGGAGSDGVLDLTQDGHADWIFISFVPGMSITFSAFANAIEIATRQSQGTWLKDGTYISPGTWFQQLISDFKELAFHEIGDVDYTRIIDINDLSDIARYMPKNVPPAPTNLDITGDKLVDIDDLYTAGSHFGRKYG